MQQYITGPEMALCHKGTNVRWLSGAGGCTQRYLMTLANVGFCDLPRYIFRDAKMVDSGSLFAYLISLTCSCTWASTISRLRGWFTAAAIHPPGGAANRYRKSEASRALGPGSSASRDSKREVLSGNAYAEQLNET